MIPSERNKTILRKYIPEPAVDVIAHWIIKLNFKLKVKKPRLTKEGDYMAPHNGKNHVITINKDLNKYAFLITLIHEIAHLTTWEKYKGRVSPHGKEWKDEYSILLNYFLKLNKSISCTNDANLFPDEIAEALHLHAVRPSASSCSDISLARVLKQFDSTTNAISLEQIQVGALFRIDSKSEKRNQEIFIKGDKRRTRIKCMHSKSKREYLIHALCKVIPV